LILLFNILFHITLINEIIYIDKNINKYINTINITANMLCAEASHDWRECNAIMQVALNRKKYYQQSLQKIITAKYQFATSCPKERLHYKHYLIAVYGTLNNKDLILPTWMNESILWFCTPAVAHKWKRKYKPVGRLRHIFWKK